ncbi:striatin-4 isoform X1 [Histomonas meleagridis]|uniref:striatin-4 isoform X1 n=1 Tax=Histomonas meleagridis TaxID=135588 RepID=UPI003559DE81|nr:striatin-4 isoform X1 [Histomonas meleagridis]KAH0797555.1 striatin-4 isoform X1 [Histomonas meleagridis]
MSSLESLVQRVKLHQERAQEWAEERNKLKTELSILTGKAAARMMCQKELEEQIFQLQKLLGVQPQSSPTASIVTPRRKVLQTAEPPKAESIDHSQPYKYRPRNTLNVHLDCVRALCFYQTQPILVSASDDGTIRVINIDPKPATATKRKVKRNPVNIASLRGHPAPVLVLKSFMKDGVQMMLSGDLEGNVAVWEMPVIGCALYDTHGVVTHHRTKLYKIHSDSIWSIDIVGNKAITASSDGTLKMFNIDDGIAENVKTASKPLFVCGYGDDKYVVCNDNNVIQLFKVNEEIGQTTIPSRAYSMTIVKNEGHLVLGCEDNQIRIINIQKMELIKEFVAHEKPVSGVAVTPCGHFIVSTSHDLKVRVWRVDTYKMEYDDSIHKDKYGEGILCCAASSPSCTKHLFATGGADGSIHVFVQV